MQLIRTTAHARAGLVGNPSDGYFGKTISAIVRNFRARVTLYEWDQVEIVWSQEDQSRFRSVRDLARDVRLHGYYGGIRLVKATIKKFVEFCGRAGIALHDRNFSIRYESDIPRQCGLAGSSAIIVATLRALLQFYEIAEDDDPGPPRPGRRALPKSVQASLVLSVEKEELSIAAGLQDRVIQVYEGLVYMDFARAQMHDEWGLQCGVYRRLDPALLPPLYLAYGLDEAEPTEVTHKGLQARYYVDREERVIRAMEDFAALTVRARDALLGGDAACFSACIDRNFDLRDSICVLPEGQRRMVTEARAAGASAAFTGSGGAIVGVCPNEATFAALKARLGAIGCQVIRPIVAE